MFHYSDSIVYLETIDQSYDFRTKKGDNAAQCKKP